MWSDDEEFEDPHIELRPIDYVKSMLFNAHYSGLTLDEICKVAEHAESVEALDEAVNLLT